MRLFEGLEDPFQVWMSHGDKLSALPEGFFDIGATSNAEHAAIARQDRVMYAGHLLRSPRNRSSLWRQCCFLWSS